ncbi:Na+/H+ antiporter NhaC family protein [Mycoplasmatota bacterium]|nr:Na+/H+ antiporter NhaC family protein [Mycoplasmatota bacterium]
MKKGNFIGLLPLIFFLVLYMSTGIITGKFDSMPLLLGFVLSAGFALLLDKKGEKTSLNDKIDIFAKAGGDGTIILMVVIFLLAGAFYSIADAMGAVNSTVNLGLTFLPSNMILPGLFLVGCVLSFSMGTSMGTITALGTIGVGISTQTGISLPLVMATVVGSALLLTGDHLSSDTTIAAIRTQGVESRDKFKANLMTVLPAVIITVIILTFLSTGNAEELERDFNLVRTLPYVAIIASALLGVNVMVTLGLGIGTGAVIGLAYGDFNVVELFGVLQRGMGWMEDLAIIAIIVGGLVGLMTYYGGIDFLLEKVTSRVKTKKGAQLGMASLVSLIDVATTNNTIAILAAGPLAKDLSEEYDIDPKRTASLLDVFSSGFQGITPYAGQLLVAAGIAGISPMEIVPYSFYSFLMIIFGLVFIFFDISKITKKK